MTTYSTIANTEIDQDSPVTQPLMTAIRDNPLSAFAEADATARAAGIYNGAGWHPVGGAALFDFARDGAVASPIQTAAFEDGYEYLIFCNGISTSNAGSTTLSIDLYRETSAAYQAMGNLATLGGASAVDVIWRFILPRTSASFHNGTWFQRTVGSANSVSIATGETGWTITHATSQKIGKARLNWSAGTFDAGTIWVLRRFEYVSA